MVKVIEEVVEQVMVRVIEETIREGLWEVNKFKMSKTLDEGLEDLIRCKFWRERRVQKVEVTVKK